jgi:membrane associated rhomboid family serine protease
LLPIKDEHRIPIIPYVTLTLVALNIAMWIYQLTLPEQLDRLLIIKYGVVPSFITGLSDIDLPADWFPRVFTLFSFQFLHGDLFHLAGNMLYLWIFGNNIEAGLGRLRYVSFYLLGGALAGITHILVGPSSEIPMIGASGSIAAILGAYLVLYPRSRIVIFIWFFFFVRLVPIPALAVLGVWFILQVISVGGEGTAWMAHIGGFVAGMLLIRYFMPKQKPKPRTPRTLH